MTASLAVGMHSTDGEIVDLQTTLGAMIAGALPVTRFGAVGNGVADDTLAFVNAIAALPSVGGIIDARGLTGGTVLTSLTISKSAVTILWPCATVSLGTNSIKVAVGTHDVAFIGAVPYGSGSAGTALGTFFSYTGTGTAIVVGDSTNDTLGFTLQDCTVSISSAGSAAIGIQLNRAINYNLVRARVSGTNAASTQIAIDLEGGVNYTGGLMLAPYTTGCNTGILLGKNANHNTVVNGSIYGPGSTGTGINFAGATGGTISGGFFGDMDIENWATGANFDFAAGVEMRGGRFENVQHITATANSFDNTVTYFSVAVNPQLLITDSGSINSFMPAGQYQLGFSSTRFLNGLDATKRVTIEAGRTSGQAADLVFIDGVSHNDKWTVRKDAASSYTVLDSTNSNQRRYYMTAGTNGLNEIDAAGTGVIRFNAVAGSGTGGVQFWNGGATPALVASISSAGAILPATPAGASQTGQLFMGSGVPSNANGNDGDFYLRTDGGAGTCIYQHRAGSWVATAA